MAKKKQQRRPKAKKIDLKLNEVLSPKRKKKSGGRRKKYVKGLPPEMVATMHRFAEYPYIDMKLFWSVFRYAKEPSGPADIDQFADELEWGANEVLKTAKAIHKAEIGAANDNYEIAKAYFRNSCKEADLIRSLIDDATIAYPEIKSIYVVKKLAIFCAQRKQVDHHWCRTLQSTFPKKYQNLTFYAALSSWFEEKTGIERSPDRLRQEILLASTELSSV